MNNWQVQFPRKLDAKLNFWKKFVASFKIAIYLSFINQHDEQQMLKKKMKYVEISLKLIYQKVTFWVEYNYN